MKSSLINVYNDKVDCGVDNEYPTSKRHSVSRAYKC